MLSAFTHSVENRDTWYTLITSVNSLSVILASGTHLDDAEALANQMLDVTRGAKSVNQAYVTAIFGMSRTFKILKGTARNPHDRFDIFAYLIDGFYSAV